MHLIRLGKFKRLQINVSICTVNQKDNGPGGWYIWYKVVGQPHVKCGSIHISFLSNGECTASYSSVQRIVHIGNTLS